MRNAKTGTETVAVAFRVPLHLVHRLDQHAKRMGQHTPGLVYSRVDALKVLLTKALDQEEQRTGGSEHDL